MSITNYTELKAAILDWMARSDISGSAADFIALGEARLNRIIGPVGTTASLTGVISSQTLSVSSLSIHEPQNLYVTQGVSEYYLTPRALGTYATTSIAARPSIWSIEGTNITFDRPLDSAYAFRFVYLGRLGLSDATPTNELLTRSPDVYLAASIVWGSVYTKDIPAAAMWKQILDEFTEEVALENSRKKRSQLTVDPALGLMGRNRYTIGTDGNL